MCFATDAQLTDGICRSVWGMQPLWLRASAWWLRDMVMLGGIAYLFDFTIHWAYASLDRKPQQLLLVWLRAGTLLVMLEMSICTVCLLMNNEFKWMYGILIGVIGLNAVSSSISIVLIWSILPDVKTKLRSATTDGMLCNSLVFEATFISKMILLLAVLVLGVFIPLSLTRLLDGAWGWSLVPGVPQGTWIGNTRFPPLARLPVEAPSVLPNPAVEFVELALGWSLCVSMLVSRGCGNVDRPSCGYVAASDLGCLLHHEEASKDR